MITLRVTSADRQVRENQMLDAVEVPVVAGDDLVVPLQLAGVDIDGEDRADVEIVLVLDERCWNVHGCALPVPT